MTHAHPTSSATPGPTVGRGPVARRRRAFTLIEILVVMGIIILLIALALPAFSFITGSRSAEAASNQIAAALSVARSQAIGLQKTRGIAVYRDVNNDRSVAAIIELRSSPFSVWAPGIAGGTPGEYTRGQYVQRGANAYVCLETYKDPAGASQFDPATAVVPPNIAYWRQLKSVQPIYAPATPLAATFVELVPGAETIQLPIGIDARGVSNEFRYPNPTYATGSPQLYRYVNPVIILFDADGQIVSTPYLIAQEGLLGDSIRTLTSTAQPGGFVPVPQPTAAPSVPYGYPNTPLPPGASSVTPATSSQIGLVLLDAEVFKNTTPNLNDPSALPTQQQVVDSNNWLDQNSTPLMVNRFNGTLVKGE